ncbi:MAG: hypothetical protein HYX89_04780, partial [Chloroflexi bacterium]|nr:hypothetical protein [Chloroflexota bacterium]
KVAMLKTGEMDVASVTPDSIADLKKAGLRVMSIEGDIGFWAWPFYDTKNPASHPLGDVRVRKALQLALNSKEMADSLFQGAGGAYALPMVSRDAYFFDPNVIKPEPYDPEQAKKLLAEAGYPSGFATKILDTGGGGSLSTVNTAMAGYWGRIGVKADIQPIDYSLIPPMLVPQISPEIWGKLWASGPSGGRQGFEGISLCYHSKFGCAKNHTNARLDELIEKVPMTGDPAEKKRLALEAAVLVKKEYITLAIVAAYRNLAYNSSKIELDQAHLYPSGSDLAMIELPWVRHAK